MTGSRAPVAIALGSNLGDRQAHLAFAVARLRSLLSSPRVSAVIETEPEGVSDAQGPFLNAVVVGGTDLTPRGLLERLLAVERERDRERPHHHAARTLDLDLVLYGNWIVDEPGLRVPHPRFRERRFVLAPLAEVAGDWIDPVTGLTVSDLYRRLDRA